MKTTITVELPVQYGGQIQRECRAYRLTPSQLAAVLLANAITEVCPDVWLEWGRRSNALDAHGRIAQIDEALGIEAATVEEPQEIATT